MTLSPSTEYTRAVWKNPSHKYLYFSHHVPGDFPGHARIFRFSAFLPTLFMMTPVCNPVTSNPNIIHCSLCFVLFCFHKWLESEWEIMQMNRYKYYTSKISLSFDQRLKFAWFKFCIFFLSSANPWWEWVHWYHNKRKKTKTKNTKWCALWLLNFRTNKNAKCNGVFTNPRQSEMLFI